VRSQLRLDADRAGANASQAWSAVGCVPIRWHLHQVQSQPAFGQSLNKGLLLEMSFDAAAFQRDGA